MKKILERVTAMLCAATMTAVCVGTATADNEWGNIRGNNENNAVVNMSTPTSPDNAAMYWATKIGSDWSDAPSPVTLDGDYLYFASGTKLYRMNKDTGKTDTKTGTLAADTVWSMIAPNCADGMVFVGLGNGTVQAFDENTMESIWVYKDAIGGDPNVPLTYNDGKLYTGFWNSETDDANYVCIDTKAESTADKEKKADWTYTHAGGFYWAGAYVNDKFVAVGAEDGSAVTADTGCLFTLDKNTGKEIDSIKTLHGDVRSCVVYNAEDDNYCFTTKGGNFYTVKIDESGKISDLKTVELGKATTSTPCVSNGRAYVGVCGANAFGKYSGSGIAVIDIDTMKTAYTVDTMGYPQASGIISTGCDDEYNYVYFIENTSPSEIRYVKDKKGMTKAEGTVKETNEGVTYDCAPVLFTPIGEQENYATSSLICDDNGTFYFKNDSSYIMAVGQSVKSIKANVSDGKSLYKEGEAFDMTGVKVTAEMADGSERDITDKVTVPTDKLTKDDTFVTFTYDYALYHDTAVSGSVNKTGVKFDTLEATADINVVDEASYNKIKAVEKLIDEIGEVTADSGDKITAAKKAYEALEDNLKSMVENYDVLTNAEKTYASLTEKKDDSSSNSSSSSSSEVKKEDSSSSSEIKMDSDINIDVTSGSNGSKKNTNTGAAASTFCGIALLAAVIIATKKK